MKLLDHEEGKFAVQCDCGYFAIDRRKCPKCKRTIPKELRDEWKSRKEQKEQYQHQHQHQLSKSKILELPKQKSFDKHQRM